MNFHFHATGSHFEKARDVYEEAAETVMTVRDFGEVFDAYAQFEESMISAKLEESKQGGLDANQEIDLELRMARFEVRYWDRFFFSLTTLSYSKS